jgi:hypothetical protein
MASLRLTVAALALATLAGGGVAAAAPVDPSLALSNLDGSTTPTRFALDIDVTGATSAKLLIDGQYVDKDDAAPLSFDVSVTPGTHKVKVRSVVGGDEIRYDASFTAVADGTVTAPPATTDPAPEKPAPDLEPTPGPEASVPPVVSGTVSVDTPDALRAALASAVPGTVIDLADGEYQFKPRLVASASGTKAAPITLRGSRGAVIRTKNASGDYGLHITGDYWRVEGITVAHATKGIVLDGSVGTVLDGVEVYDIGDEAIHFRTCSSDGVLRNSYVHDTGVNSAQYGEGVYVGSANSNWSKYQCTDAVEGQTRGDNTERVLIENNVFEDITAEGADLKEGTDSGILRRNTFRRAGVSGMNSADSAVDAKGNNWLIEGNVVSDTDKPWMDDGVARPSEFLDGFQAHSVYSGYGTGNVFRANKVIGAIPGYGIGLFPAGGNVVTCDNSAPGAAKGLVGANSKPATCTG